MKIFDLKFKILFAVCLLFAGCSFSYGVVFAQTSPQFMISWKANNYVPNWYEGKIFPTAGTKIDVGFELINNGKLADLSDTKVRWYVNNKLVKNEANGLGIKKISFNAPNYFGQNVEVRIVLVDFAGGGLIDKIIEIPVVRPEAVINAPYKNNGIKIGGSIFNVSPFFFSTNNIDDFVVEWSIRGQESASSKGDPFSLNLKIDPQMPIGSVVNLSVTMSNVLKILESASDVANLTIK